MNARLVSSVQTGFGPGLLCYERSLKQVIHISDVWEGCSSNSDTMISVADLA